VGEPENSAAHSAGVRQLQRAGRTQPLGLLLQRGSRLRHRLGAQYAESGRSEFA
jgi:hypothetical protein